MAVQERVPFANIEAVFIAAMYARGPGVGADTSTPDPEEFTGEWYRIVKTGGRDDGRNRDLPRIQVGAFAQTYDRAVELSELARSVMHGLKGEAVALHDKGLLVQLGDIRTATSPERIPTAPPGLVYDSAYYDVVAHRPLPLTVARAAAAVNPEPLPDLDAEPDEPVEAVEAAP